MSGANLSGIDTFFNARCVAIYGASASPNSVGQAIIQHFIKPQYTGKVYDVNPKYTTILGVPCYPSLQEIPEPVDLVGRDFTTKAGEIMELMGVPTYATGEKGALAAKALALYGETKYGKDFKKTFVSDS